MIGSGDGRRIEIDKALNALQDQNASSFKVGYCRKTDPFFKVYPKLYFFLLKTSIPQVTSSRLQVYK
ncbi:MAG: hypothetical protein MI921_28450 [Cytophagales bacterium]|nr:hypothetical protein [Cytophagales bacterium]